MSVSPKLGVCYYPEHWPESRWADDAAQMVAMGLSYVRIGEFAWSRIEPREGHYDWAWLDRAVDTLGAAGLQIIMGTPTATPPRWMIAKFPDMLAFDQNGHPRRFGSRRHYCFSHEGYKSACVDIATDMATRYAHLPHVHSWQIDNEYGCHDTILSYSPVATRAFQNWLSEKYGTIDALNVAWGTVFWSMEYRRFDDVGLPNLTVTEPNPSHVMDFRRFSSDQTMAFNQAQAAALRRITDKPLIHNYMGRITDFDHYDVGADLNIATWDSYPLGFLEDRSDQDEDFKHAYQRQGDPDFQAFHHDLYRAVGRGRWGVMEQQPGPVNWAPYNPAPLPGMVRLWSWEAFAHGAEFVNYFRWRQAPFGQEQMHAGLLRPDGEPASVAQDVAQVAREIAALKLSGVSPAPIAIIFDYASAWAWETQPQGQGFDYFRLVFDMYSGLRKLGQSVDIITPQTQDFSERKLVLIPGLFCWTDALRSAVRNFDGKIIVGPRTGSKTADFHIPDTLPPSVEGMDLKVISIDTLRQSSFVALENDRGAFHLWFEHIETTEDVTARTACGQPAIVSKDNRHYLCGWPDDTAMMHILSEKVAGVGLTLDKMPEGVRRHDMNSHIIYTNYSAHPVTVEGRALAPAGVRVIEKTTQTIIIEQ